jgi:hypothetical protein
MAVELFVELIEAGHRAESSLIVSQRDVPSDVVRDYLLKVLRLELLSGKDDAFQAETL